MEPANLSHSTSIVSVKVVMFGGDRPRIVRLIDQDTSGSVLFLATMNTELTTVQEKEVNRYGVHYSINFSSPRTSPAFVACKQEAVMRLSSESIVIELLGFLKQRIEDIGVGSSKANPNIFFVATVEPHGGHNAFASIIRFGFGRTGEVIKRHEVEIVHSASPGRATPFEELEGKFLQKLRSIDIAADLVSAGEKVE